jgi:hypothetical protein
MNQNEYEEFRWEDSHIPVTVVTAEKVGGENRTLTLGYDLDRNTFHAYLHEGRLYVRTYNYERQILSDASGPVLLAEFLRPNKRVYPQYTDGNFARIMRDLDFPLPFTTWSEPKREGPYYGATHLDEAIAPEA